MKFFYLKIWVFFAICFSLDLLFNQYIDIFQFLGSYEGAYDEWKLDLYVSPGVRYRFVRYFSASADDGWQLKNIIRNYEPKNWRSRAHLNLLLSF